ncbi:hypothetical protein HEP75_02026 [Xanthomonas sp. SI]|nr:hypothetical protein HEP75_02026 [Xanthomonas sp. SI]
MTWINPRHRFTASLCRRPRQRRFERPPAHLMAAPAVPFSHRDHGPLFGGRWRAAPDEGTGEASRTQTQRDAARRTLTPTPLPTGEGLCTHTAFPSPTGRRWRAAPDEGTERSLTHPNSTRRCAPYPHPNPSPDGRGAMHARLFLLPSGEGGPKGRMRVRAKPRAPKLNETLRAVPSPQPLSRRERDYARARLFLLPSGPWPLFSGMHVSAPARWRQSPQPPRPGLDQDQCRHALRCLVCVGDMRLRRRRRGAAARPRAGGASPCVAPPRRMPHLFFRDGARPP